MSPKTRSCVGIDSRSATAASPLRRRQTSRLVVDSVGFEPGSQAGSLPHSNKLHVVERFTLNPATLELTRGIVADDPV
jgi:hypothetical protein